MTTAKLNEFDHLVSRLADRVEHMSAEEFAHAYWHVLDALPPKDITLGKARLLEELVSRAVRRAS